MPIAPWNPGGYYPFSMPANTPIQGGNFGTYGNPLSGVINPTRTTAGTSSLPGGPVSGYDPAYGGVPTVPNPGATQHDVIGGNLSSLGDLYNLAKGVGSASAAGAGTQVAQNLPGFTGMTATSSGNIESLLHGNIPDDVKRQLYQAAAERGVSIGSPDSPNSDTQLLRLLGLTSLGLQGQGESELTGAIGRTPTGPAFNPASMLVDPNQQQIAQLLANYLAAAPIPRDAAGANLAALLAGAGRGARATGGGGTGGVPFTGGGGTGSGATALGFPFGSYGPTTTGTTGGGGSVASGGDPSLAGTMWDPNAVDMPSGAVTSNYTMADQYAAPIGPQMGQGIDPSLGPTGGDPMMSQQFDFTDPNWWNQLIGSGDEMNFGG